MGCRQQRCTRSHSVPLVDTGFTGYLVLPPSMIRQLGLSSRNETLTLAGDEQLTCRVYSVKVLWHELDHWVNAYELGSIPVIGMALLNGSRITLRRLRGRPRNHRASHRLTSTLPVARQHPPPAHSRQMPIAPSPRQPLHWLYASFQRSHFVVPAKAGTSHPVPA